MHSACACASASIASPSAIVCSLSIICLVIACANAGPAREPRRPLAAPASRAASPSATTRLTSPISSARSRVDHVAEEQQLARVPEPDDPRQQVRRAHVGAAQPDLREDEAELRARRRDPQVARARDHRAGADRDAVDRARRSAAGTRASPAISRPVARVNASSAGVSRPSRCLMMSS